MAGWARGLGLSALGLGVALTAAAVPTGPARAYCYYICSLAKEGQCVEHRSGCTDDGRPGRGSRPVRFGAIAYGPASQRWSYSDHYDSRSAAASRALGDCAARDCVVAAWFYASCGALATDGARAWGGAQGSSERRAAAAALARCRSEGGASCQVRLTHCSG